MNCDRVHPLLSLFVLDDLDEGEKVLVESHLEICPGCREEVDALNGLTGALREDRFPDRSEEFWARFETSVVEGTERIDQESSRSIVGLLKKLIPVVPQGKFVPAVAYASLVLVIVSVGALFVWKAHIRYSDPLGDLLTESSSLSNAAIVDISYQNYLDDMSGSELEEATLAVTEWGIGDLLEWDTVGGTYDIFDEIEDMSSEELELFTEELEDWQENS